MLLSLCSSPHTLSGFLPFIDSSCQNMKSPIDLWSHPGTLIHWPFSHWRWRLVSSIGFSLSMFVWACPSPSCLKGKCDKKKQAKGWKGVCYNQWMIINPLSVSLSEESEFQIRITNYPNLGHRCKPPHGKWGRLSDPLGFHVCHQDTQKKLLWKELEYNSRDQIRRQISTTMQYLECQNPHILLFLHLHF